MTAAMARASDSAIIAQKKSSMPINGRGSPNWLKGVKNSQKTYEKRKRIKAIRHVLAPMPSGHPRESQRYTKA